MILKRPFDTPNLINEFSSLKNCISIYMEDAELTSVSSTSLQMGRINGKKKVALSTYFISEINLERWTQMPRE